jgi:hypothetical protein
MGHGNAQTNRTLSGPRPKYRSINQNLHNDEKGTALASNAAGTGPHQVVR